MEEIGEVLSLVRHIKVRSKTLPLIPDSLLQVAVSYVD